MRDRFVILADESADWKIAGLRQLDRLVLAVNEFSESFSPESKIDIMISWEPQIAREERWLPNHAVLGRCRFVSHSASPQAAVDSREHVLSTRLLVKRRGIAQLVSNEAASPIDPSAVDGEEVWRRRWQTFEETCRKATIPRKTQLWRCLSDQSEIAHCERWLLRASGKSNDGIVARFLHRPISRAISHLLLKTEMTPNAWSVLTTVVPLIGCAFVWRGTSAAFVIGMALYQLHNVLDGCDGEIARAKYLDSERGRQIDAIGDLGATVLLALSMGVGLWRYATGHPASEFYFVEGLVAALLLALQWWISYRRDTSFGHLSRRALGEVQTKSGPSADDSFPKNVAAGVRWLLVEVTKRDVSHFFFLLLAIAGLPSWILHFLFAYALFGFALTLTALSLSGPSPRSD
jgi:hypothetical protein